MIFLDTVGMIALWNHSDQWHVQAAQAYHQLRSRRPVFATTSHVLLECGNAVARTELRAEVSRLRIGLTAQQQLIEPSGADVAEAWASV
jgi:predicted nucleic acid-binding protein